MNLVCTRSFGTLGSIALSLSFLLLSACAKKTNDVSAAPPAPAPVAEVPASGVGSDPAYPEIDISPVWAADGKLIQPKDFREMVFIGAPLTPHGLNEGKANFPEFHNVYTQPAAFKASCTSPKLSGVVITRMPSSETSMSSAPASSATSMILSSKDTSSKLISPRLVNK